MSRPPVRPAGRRWAYAGLVFGAAGSVAANVTHAFLRPAGAPAGWHVEAGAVAWGVAVAVCLLISVEVLARVDWPRTFGWSLARYAGGSTVALVAAATSYRHLADLLRHWHETGLIAAGGPAIVDGLMILCSFALMVPERTEPAAIATVTAVAAAPPPTPDPPPKPVKQVAAARAQQRRPVAPAGDLPPDVLEVGRQVLAELADGGGPLTHRSLLAGFRSRDLTLSSDRASALLKALKESAS